MGFVSKEADRLLEQFSMPLHVSDFYQAEKTMISTLLLWGGTQKIPVLLLASGAGLQRAWVGFCSSLYAQNSLHRCNSVQSPS